jgi:hypothetical protein
MRRRSSIRRAVSTCGCVPDLRGMRIFPHHFIAFGVQTPPMSTAVNREHLGGVRTSTVPLRREMPLTDLLRLGDHRQGQVWA